MALISGTITGVQLVTGNPAGVGAMKGYLLTVSFPAYTGSTDSMTIPAVGATITAHLRNGKTSAMVAGAVPVRAFAGQDTNAQAVYAGTLTISTDALTGNLTDAAQTEITTSTACQGVGIFVPVVES